MNATRQYPDFTREFHAAAWLYLREEMAAESVPPPFINAWVRQSLQLHYGESVPEVDLNAALHVYCGRNTGASSAYVQLNPKDPAYTDPAAYNTAHGPFAADIIRHAVAFEYLVDGLADWSPESIWAPVSIDAFCALLITGREHNWKTEATDHGVTIAGEEYQVSHAAPADVATLIEALCEWGNTTVTDTLTLHQALMCAVIVHLRLLSICPFAGGNGIVARMVGSIPLLINGYPPLIYHTRHAEAYHELIAHHQLGIGRPTPRRGTARKGRGGEIAEHCDFAYTCLVESIVDPMANTWHAMRAELPPVHACVESLRARLPKPSGTSPKK